MLKRILILAALAVGGLIAAAPKQAEAGVIVGRVAPVRRVVYRTTLPPYPVARRVVVGPVYRPIVHPVYRPVVVPGPVFYGPGVVIAY